VEDNKIGRKMQSDKITSVEC